MEAIMMTSSVARRVTSATARVPSKLTPSVSGSGESRGPCGNRRTWTRSESLATVVLHGRLEVWPVIHGVDSTWTRDERR